MSGSRWTLAVHGARLTVEVDSDELARLGRSFYPDYLAAASGDPELQLETRGDGYAVLSRSGTPTVERTGLSLAEAVFLFELLAAERLLRRLPMHVLHAGAIDVGGRALLFSGWGGAGKSSLVAAFARRGRALYGDDVVLLDAKEGHVHPFRRFVKLADPVPQILGLGASVAATDNLWEESHYYPDDLGSRWAEPAPIGWVVFPLYAPDGPAAELGPLTGGEAVRRLMEQILLSDGVGTAEFDALTASLADADFFQLRFSELQEAADTLLEELEER